MDIVLVAFSVFKGLVFVTGMVFAIKWHHEQEKKRAGGHGLLRMGAKVFAIFLVLLVVLLTLTFTLASSLGMDLNLP